MSLFPRAIHQSSGMLHTEVTRVDEFVMVTAHGGHLPEPPNTPGLTRRKKPRSSIVSSGLVEPPKCDYLLISLFDLIRRGEVLSRSPRPEALLLWAIVGPAIPPDSGGREIGPQALQTLRHQAQLIHQNAWYRGASSIRELKENPAWREEREALLEDSALTP